MEGPSGPPSIPVSEDDDDSVLAKSQVLTRQELLQRRLRLTRRLTRYYREYYWLLMEELRRKHREYYWIYGKSPCIKEAEETGNCAGEGNGEHAAFGGVGVNNVNGSNGVNNNNDVKSGDKLGLENGESFNWCSYNGCEAKAMALTRYCLTHITFDTKQKLYKQCKYPQVRLNENGDCIHGYGDHVDTGKRQMKQVGSHVDTGKRQMKPVVHRDDPKYGPVFCNKTILSSASLCHNHAVLAKKHINQALKRAGASATVSNKAASKFHLVINEYVRLIQSKRRDIARRNMDSIAVQNGHN